MNNLAILGPNKRLENKLKENAFRLVNETVPRYAFNNAYMLSNRHYRVMNGRGQIVGFAMINRNNKNEKGNLKLHLIGTNKGKGIGRLLMMRIINNARNRGLKTITLESVPEARGFYNKLGFKPLGSWGYMRYYIT